MAFAVRRTARLRRAPSNEVQIPRIIEEISAVLPADADGALEYLLSQFDDAATPFEKKFAVCKLIYRRFLSNRPPTDQRPASSHTEHILACMKRLLSDARKELRAFALRILRHVCLLAPATADTVAATLDQEIVCILELPDGLHKKERSQAMQLVRTLVAQCTADLPATILSSILAIAESDDQLSEACATLAAELLLRRPALLVRAGAVQTLLRLVLETVVPARTEMLMLPILHTMNSQEGRALLPVASIFRFLMAPFLDAEFVLQEADSAPGKPSERSVRHTAARIALAAILRTWAGLTIFFSSKELAGALVAALRGASLDSSLALKILELLFSVFHLAVPSGSTFVEATRGRVCTTAQIADDLIDMYHGALLVGFLSWDILPALEHIAIATTDSTVSLQATILLADLMNSAAALLPPSITLQYNNLSILTLASTGRGAGLFQDGSDANERTTRSRTIASNLSSLRNMHRDIPQLHMSAEWTEISPSDLLTESPDSSLSARIKASRVLDARDGTSWNFVAAMDALRTPGLLCRPDALTLRFLRRALVFYRPTAMQFTAIARSPHFNNVAVRRFGCALLAVLAVSPEESKLVVEVLREFADMLEHADEPIPAGLSISAIQDTHCGDYFTMIGALNRSDAGRALLFDAGVYSRMLNVVARAERSDLIRLIAQSMSTSDRGMARTVLTAILTGAKQELRLHATHHLGSVLLQREPGSSPHALHMLISQLYDTDTDVRAEALSSISRLCCDPAHLVGVAALKPALAHLGAATYELQVRLLSCPPGLECLRTGFVPQVLEQWRRCGNREYAVAMDSSLAGALASRPVRSVRVEPSLRPHVAIRLHLYAQLCATEAGTALLAADHFDQLVSLVLHPSPDDSLMDLKAALWAVGHACSVDPGASWLLRTHPDLLRRISDLFERSPILSLRGVSFFVLCLAARSNVGRDALSRLGWESAIWNHGALAVPRDRDAVFALELAAASRRTLLPCSFGLTLVLPQPPPPSVAHTPSSTQAPTPAKALSPATVSPLTSFEPCSPTHASAADAATARAQILMLISDLGNDVIATKARNGLSRWRNTHSHLFDESLLRAAAAQIAQRPLSLPARRYVHNLFQSLELYRRAANPPASAPASAEPTPPPLPDRALKQSPAARPTSAVTEDATATGPVAPQGPRVLGADRTHAQAALAATIPVSATGSSDTLVSRTDVSSLTVAPPSLQDGPGGMLPVHRRNTHAPTQAVTLAELEAMSSDESSPAANMPPPYLGPIPTSFAPTQPPVFNFFPPPATGAATSPSAGQTDAQPFASTSAPLRAHDQPATALAGPTGIEEDEDDYQEDERLAREMAEAEMRQATHHESLA